MFVGFPHSHPLTLLEHQTSRELKDPKNNTSIARSDALSDFDPSELTFTRVNTTPTHRPLPPLRYCPQAPSLLRYPRTQTPSALAFEREIMLHAATPGFRERNLTRSPSSRYEFAPALSVHLDVYWDRNKADQSSHKFDDTYH